MDDLTDRGPALGPGGLTPYQIQVAQLFFSLPASNGFLLAGGAALVARHLTTRPTHDLDFFTRPGQAEVPTACAAFEAAATAQGWTVHRVRDTATFCRLVVSGPEDLLVNLADLSKDAELLILTSRERRTAPTDLPGPLRSCRPGVAGRLVPATTPPLGEGFSGYSRHDPGLAPPVGRQEVAATPHAASPDVPRPLRRPDGEGLSLPLDYLAPRGAPSPRATHA